MPITAMVSESINIRFSVGNRIKVCRSSSLDVKGVGRGVPGGGGGTSDAGGVRILIIVGCGVSLESVLKFRP
jgi:hypothetical protein